MFRSLGTTIPVALILFALSGCKTTGQDRTAAQIESLKQLRMSLDAGSKQINATVGSLEQLAATSTGDLRPAYQKFTAELAKLDADAATSRSRADAMKASAKEHLDKWEEESRAGITNPEIGNISAEQRDKAKERFEELRSTAEAGRDAYQKLSTKLHEIQKVLDLNLSPAGIAAIKPVIETTKVDARAVNDALGQIVGKLDNVANALSSAPASAPAPASGPAGPPAPSANP